MGAQVVALRGGEVEELRGDHAGDGVVAWVGRARSTVAVAEVAGRRGFGEEGEGLVENCVGGGALGGGVIGGRRRRRCRSGGKGVPLLSLLLGFVEVISAPAILSLNVSCSVPAARVSVSGYAGKSIPMEVRETTVRKQGMVRPSRNPRPGLGNDFRKLFPALFLSRQLMTLFNIMQMSLP